MGDTRPERWLEANQRCLQAEIAKVRAALEAYSARCSSRDDLERPGAREATGGRDDGGPGTRGDAARIALEAASRGMPAPSALEALATAFSLTAFERAVLTLCAGVELDAGFAACCAAAHGDPRRVLPSFGLALAALPDAHWSALAPAAPLRRWRLIEVMAGDTLTGSPIRIDERVLHQLTGVSYLDSRLEAYLEPIQRAGGLPPSHRAIAERMAARWSGRAAQGARPSLMLCGPDGAARGLVAAEACGALGLQLYGIRSVDLPVPAQEREALIRLIEREALLGGSALLLETEDGEGPERVQAAATFAEHLRAPLVVSGREPLRLRARGVVRFDLERPAGAEQRALWDEALGALSGRLNGHVDHVVQHFQLGLEGIRAAAAQVSGLEREGLADDAIAPLLWESCRAQARPKLDDLAQRIAPNAGWEDLVLPEAPHQILQDIATHVRQRGRVYDAWGFGARGARGLGISALFAGPSGTGKTLAAEVLATALRLDLYRIDLSAVVSKYIGETEKNLRRVFDAAEEGGAVLLFDEADALFGKRSEVRDSHDRYANIEVSYLLQRMEVYRGLAILTTNLKDALDRAFLRRIRFVVQFPFPDATQRAEIWRRVFPPETPVRGIDAARLARLNLAGGNIRNIALHAAFLAADEGAPVQMRHLARAARAEYAKLEKPMSEAEIGGWT